MHLHFIIRFYSILIICLIQCSHIYEMQHSHVLPAGFHLKYNDMEVVSMVVVVVVTMVVVEAFIFSYLASLLFTIAKKVKVISFLKWEAKI